MTRSQRRGVALVLAVALALRLGWALSQPTSREALGRLPDQMEYLALAGHLLHAGTLEFFDARFPAFLFADRRPVVAYRLPGYPAFIAACGGSVRAVRVVQAVVDTGTVLATCILARRLSGSTPVGIAAAAWVAVNPLYIYFSGLLLTETLFAAALAWAVVAATGGAMPSAVALFAAALYIRPTMLVLAPALVAVTNRSTRAAYRWGWPLLTVVVLIVSLVPWAVRNDARLGEPVWTTTNDGVTLYDGFHDGATGGSDQRFLTQMPRLRSMTEVARSHWLSDHAWRWATEHPSELVPLTLRKIGRGWSPVPLSQDFGRPLYRWVGGGYAVPFDLLCLVGLASGRLTRQSKLLLVTPALVLTAVQAATVGSIRYRMPAEALLAVLAGQGVVDLWSAVRASAKRDERNDAVAGHHSPSPV